MAASSGGMGTRRDSAGPPCLSPRSPCAEPVSVQQRVNLGPGLLQGEDPQPAAGRWQSWRRSPTTSPGRSAAKYMQAYSAMSRCRRVLAAGCRSPPQYWPTVMESSTGSAAERPARTVSGPRPFAHLDTQLAPLYRRVMGVFTAAKQRFVVHLRPDDAIEALRADSLADPVTTA